MPSSAEACSWGQPIGACTITASFSNIHGAGEAITSGTYGLQEALNAAQAQIALVSRAAAQWRLAQAGRLSAAQTHYRHCHRVPKCPHPRPAQRRFVVDSSTLHADRACYSGNADRLHYRLHRRPGRHMARLGHLFLCHLCGHLGGESPVSLTYNQTPTVNYTLNVTSPVVSTARSGGACMAGTFLSGARLSSAHHGDQLHS